MCIYKQNAIKALETPISQSVLFDAESSMAKSLFEQFLRNANVHMVAVNIDDKQVSKIDKKSYQTIESLAESNESYFVLTQDSGVSLVYSVSKSMFKLCE